MVASSQMGTMPWGNTGRRALYRAYIAVPRYGSYRAYIALYTGDIGVL